MMKLYLKDDFQIPLEEPLYNLKLTNSLQLAIEVSNLKIMHFIVTFCGF